MKKVLTALGVALFSTVWLCLGAHTAFAQCGTQGAFAFGLAQRLGFTVPDEPGAINALDKVGISRDIFDREACMTEEVVVQVDKALRRAIKLGLLTYEETFEVIEGVLAFIGEGSLAVVLRQRMPDAHFGLQGPIGGPPLEGTFEIQTTSEEVEEEEEEETTTSEASDFFP